MGEKNTEVAHISFFLVKCDCNTEFYLQDYEKIAPPNSFIHVEDFESPQVIFNIYSFYYQCNIYCKIHKIEVIWPLSPLLV